MHARRTLGLVALVLVIVGPTGAAWGPTPPVELVSVALDGGPADGDSSYAEVSADGRHVLFASAASNLVPGDTNQASDIFVRDLITGTTERVSLGHDGRELAGHSFGASISRDGRVVAFRSSAPDVVPGPHDGLSHLYVRDRASGTIQRADENALGQPGNSHVSHEVSLSGDGRRVAFVSYATNLDPADTNGGGDVYVRDLDAAAASLVGRTPAGTSFPWGTTDPSITLDGWRVSFTAPEPSAAALSVWVHDVEAGTTGLASVPGVAAWGGGISPDGRFVGFNAFIPWGPEGGPAVVRDVDGGAWEPSPFPEATDAYDRVDLSHEARYVAFSTMPSSNPLGLPRAVYRWERATGTMEAANVNAAGEIIDWAFKPSISADGTRLAFATLSPNLVPGDTNGDYDIFVRRYA